jgi:hypothetical protein
MKLTEIIDAAFGLPSVTSLIRLVTRSQFCALECGNADFTRKIKHEDGIFCENIKLQIVWKSSKYAIYVKNPTMR